LAAALSLATYGTPTVAAPVVFRGYTSAANDGGIGGISGNNSVAIQATGSFTNFVDMHLHNCGAAVIVTLSTGMLVNCELNNTSGNAVAGVTNIFGCKIHDIGGVGIAATGGHWYFNFLKNGTKTFTTAISTGATGIAIGFNIISIGGSSSGINLLQSGTFILNNSIYSAGGTGTGIINPNNAARNISIINNIIEGFSGAGGKGISIVTGPMTWYANNKYYNNATHENITGNLTIDLLNNSVLSASAFASPSTDNFMVDTSIKAGAYPTSFKGSITNQFLDVGAAQREEAASGGGLIRHPGMAGGLNG